MAPRGPRLTRNSSNTDIDKSAPATTVYVQPPSSQPGPLPSLSDSIEDQDNINIQKGSTHQRRARGRCSGESILKAMARNLDIEFPESLARPVKNASYFATGIGIMIRRHAPVKDITRYDEIALNDRELLYGGLMAWFEIKNFRTNPSVEYKLNDMLQTCYRHWRNEMHKAYKDLKDAGQDPKNACPFDCFEDEVWEAVCDSFEDPKFKNRSRVNQDNRKRLPYPHASGSQSFHVRYYNMIENERSHITNWTQCHTRKNGQLVNQHAELLAEEMVNKRRQRTEAGQHVVEEEILSETLGKRVGYSKGMGYGFIPPQSTNPIRARNLDALRIAHEQLQKHIENQQQTILEQNAKIEEQSIIIGQQNSTISTMLENQKRLEEKVEKILAAFGRI